MKTLYINSCVRENSRTDELAKYVLQKFGNDYEEVKLNKEKILPLKRESLLLRDKFIQNKNFEDDMFKYAKQFSKADIIVVSAPHWDLSFPALLKTYFEHINVSGLTFRYNEQGIPETLCQAKRLVYVTTSGGKIFSDDFGFGYVKALANAFYGLQDIKYFKAEELDIIGADIKYILDNAKKEIDTGL